MRIGFPIEDPQFILGLNLRLTDTKRTTLEASDISKLAVKLIVMVATFKLEKTEEKLIENLQAEVEELKALLSKKNNRIKVTVRPL